ncbi:MAG: hypothetical protein Q7S27_06370 [Nanoarchaeota archaeon]|nr:hypothetical protein [Nanoarchaeota archaeon]
MEFLLYAIGGLPNSNLLKEGLKAAKKNKVKGGLKKMRFSFKKIGSVLASTAMLSSTIALAAAANFPAPFIQGGAGDVAIVHGGANAAYTDLVAVTDISSYLSTQLAKQTAKGSGGTTADSVSGEASPLFTSGSKLYVDDVLNTVKNTLTETELPTVLVDGTFSGNVEATFTQKIEVGSWPTLNITYAKHPTSSDDPQFGIALSTTSAIRFYNSTITFSKAVNFTHADSEGQDITMFGQKFTIASATSDTNLVLLKTAERVSLSNDDPSAEVTISGKTYTIELVSASDTAATVKVTDSDGKSETKEVNENASKKINGITVAITNADETNLKLSASVIAGAEKVTISTTAGSNVKVGEDEKILEGTSTTVTGGTTAATDMTFGVFAPNSDNDAVIPGKSFIDPIFGTFKVDFASISVPEGSTLREDIIVADTSDDEASVTFMEYKGNSKTIQFAKNNTAKMDMNIDDDGRNITVAEGQLTYRNNYIVLGNEEEGYLVKVSTITNQVGTADDRVEFTDIFSGDTYKSSGVSTDGIASVVVGGKSYTVAYNGTSSGDANWVRVNYPDSSSATADMIAFPTIESKQGAKVAFYTPLLNLSISDWDASDGNQTGTALGKVRFPDGDGYTDVTLSATYDNLTPMVNITFGSTTTALNLSGYSITSVAGAIGRLTYNFTSANQTGTNKTNVYLINPQTLLNIVDPALVIFEEKDDKTNYEAIIVTLEPGSTGDDGIGINDAVRTWNADAKWDEISLASDSKKTKESDRWGTIALVDSSDSDQKTTTISYPGEQVHNSIYFGAISSEISGGTATGTGAGVVELGSVSVTDAEATSVAGKNLVVVGGSCVNTVAAQLLGLSGKTCGADFTAKTTVGAGQFLIETFSRTGGKVATLVAGYNAGDTTNAAKYLTTQTVDTMVGKKYKGTSATAAELMTEAGTA